MSGTVRDLILVLEAYLPPDLPVGQALCVLHTVAALFPILQHHRRQRQEPRQPKRTAWLQSITTAISRALSGAQDEHDLVDEEDEQDLGISQDIADDMEELYDLLGLDNHDSPLDILFHDSRHRILTSRRQVCISCPPTTRFRSIRLRRTPQTVKVLGPDFKWTKATLLIGQCISCSADYYPDHYTLRDAAGTRSHHLEYDAVYLKVSKHGLWCHRRIAHAQENAIREFRSGWANFANWINKTTPEGPRMTYRQSQRLFIEHFSRRLLVAHGLSIGFSCGINLKTAVFARAVRDAIGKDGGSVPGALHHGCMDCTHRKRYCADLIEEGAALDNQVDRVAEEGELNEDQNPPDPPAQLNDLPPGMPQLPPVQEPPAPGKPRGYVRMAVMDGKTIGHRICCIDNCREPLVNFKNERFCQGHLETFGGLCGIIPCGERVSSRDSLTCDNPEHEAWFSAWAGRFGRLSYPNVRRVIRQRQQRAARQPDAEAPAEDAPQLQIRLPSLGDTPGDRVVHTFRAGTVYCVETAQWACGMPIGWGKCYKSESSPQVVAFINRLWNGHENLRPSFLCYDDACDLLRHIVTQNAEDTWIKATKFIVDAWHYTGHRATDVLCRLWCNPAPTNGSQPDLIVIQRDANGRAHQTRAFNTETAEQLNAWLNNYEAVLRQMTDVNFDLYMHALFLMFKEDTESKIQRKERELPDAFWEGMGEE